MEQFVTIGPERGGQPKDYTIVQQKLLRNVVGRPKHGDFSGLELPQAGPKTERVKKSSGGTKRFRVPIVKPEFQWKVRVNVHEGSFTMNLTNFIVADHVFGHRVRKG